MQQSIGRKLRNTLYLMCSTDPNDPSRTAGVTIAVNKGIINIKDMTHQEVILGRVIIVEIPWNESNKLPIMKVYTPATNTKKAHSWKSLWETIEEGNNL